LSLDKPLIFAREKKRQKEREVGGRKRNGRGFFLVWVEKGKTRKNMVGNENIVKPSKYGGGSILNCKKGYRGR
jgi:hypothetical protein